MEILRRKSAVVATASFALARLLQVVMTFAVAHLFDKELAGITFYIFGLITFAQGLSACGLDNYGNYIIPRRRRRGRLHKMWSYLFLVVCMAIPINMLIALSVYTFPAVGTLTIAPYVFAVIALASTMGTVRRLVRLIFIGLGARSRAMVHESISHYSVLLLLFLTHRTEGVAGITTIVLIASAASFSYAMWDMRRALPRPPLGYRSELPRFRSSKIALIGAFPSFIAQGAPLLLNRADVLLLAPLSSASEVAIYSVAIRLTFLLSTVSELAGLIWGARLMNASQLALPARRRFFRKLILLTAGITATISVPLLIFPEQSLTLLFGASYADAAATLMVLIAGKLLTAPFQPLLASFVEMGHSRQLARIVVAAAITSVALSLALIPTYGALGCAMASTTALAFMAAGYTWLLGKCLK